MGREWDQIAQDDCWVEEQLAFDEAESNKALAYLAEDDRQGKIKAFWDARVEDLCRQYEAEWLTNGNDAAYLF